MLENRQSNYDQVIENWRLKFLEMDQEELIRKFQLEADEEFLYIIYFSKRFRIDRKTGFITEDGKSPGFDTVMNIYNTFYYSAAHPVASGNLVAFRQVKRVYPFEAAYRRTIISSFPCIIAYTFGVNRLYRMHINNSSIYLLFSKYFACFHGFLNH